jgi:hypothetical protein
MTLTVPDLTQLAGALALLITAIGGALARVIWACRRR